MCHKFVSNLLVSGFLKLFVLAISFSNLTSNCLSDPRQWTNFNPINMINYRRLCRVTSSPYSHNQLHQTASYVNFIYAIC